MQLDVIITAYRYEYLDEKIKTGYFYVHRLKVWNVIHSNIFLKQKKLIKVSNDSIKVLQRFLRTKNVYTVIICGITHALKMAFNILHPVYFITIKL